MTGGCEAGEILRGMDDDLLLHIAAIATVFGAALFFALMAWAGQHQS